MRDAARGLLRDEPRGARAALGRFLEASDVSCVMECDVDRFLEASGMSCVMECDVGRDFEASDGMECDVGRDFRSK
jgi:hypothetical protein